MGKIKKTKNQIRRERQKQLKLQRENPQKNDSSNRPVIGKVPQPSEDAFFETPNDIEYNPLYSEYEHILQRFQPAEPEPVFQRSESEMSDSGSSEPESEPEVELTQRQIRRRNKISLSKLKMMSGKPELVEWCDVDAKDPHLVVYLKSLHNTVPLPSHWSQKQEYLARGRGFGRQPFRLPDFIQQTGIQEMRDTTQPDDSTLKQKTRERVQPKLGRLDIDYQKLYDAFFKFQKKPRLFGFGDVYYEGRDVVQEFDASDFKPGHLSSELRGALGIAPGAPPPWLAAMATLGGPPSYPHMDVPRIGKSGNVEMPQRRHHVVNLGNPVEKGHWGGVEEEESESEAEDESESEFESAEEEQVEEEQVEEEKVEEEKVEEEQVAEEPQVEKVEEPITVEDEIAQFKKDLFPVNAQESRPLFQVLDEKTVEQDTKMMGSEHLAYDVPSREKKPEKLKEQSETAVERSERRKFRF